MLGPSHWLHEISLPKKVRHHFWPQLIPLAKNTPFQLGVLIYLFLYFFIYSQVHSCHNVFGTSYKSLQRKEKKKKRKRKKGWPTGEFTE
jgi:hypothetical protein